MNQKGLLPSRDGVSLFYDKSGDGLPLVFCPGLLCRQEHWRHQLVRFTENYQTIVVNYRGHQRSQVPINQNHLTLEWCAKDVLDILDHLKIEKAVFLCHSMGVPVVMHLNEMAPDRIMGGVFICGAVNNPLEGMFFTNRMTSVFDLSWRLFEKAPSFVTRVWKQLPMKSAFFHWVIMQLGFNPATSDPQDVESYVEGIQESSPEVFYRLLKDYGAQDRIPLVKKFDKPALVIAGGMDCVTPLPIIESMTKELSHAEIFILPEGSHNTHMDFPEEVNGRIVEFLSSTFNEGKEI